jgi:hypothetical protein
MVVVAGILLVVAAIALPVFVLSRMGATAQDSLRSAGLASARPGQEVTAIVRLGDRDTDGTYVGILIEPTGDTYVASSTTLRVRFADDIELVMGGSDDIKPQAVLQLTGTLDGQTTVIARRAVVLTGYVTVQD